MEDKNIVKIFVDNVEVEGKIINRTQCNIAIKIIKPFQNLSSGSHIPYFGMRPGHTFDGEYGDETAAGILEGLYYFGKYLDDNLEDLKEKVKILNNDIANLSKEQLTEDEFKQKKKELKKRLRNGDIDNLAYQRALAPLRKEAEKLRLDLFLKTDSFFEENFSMIVPCGTKDEFLDIINGKKNLKVDV